MGEILLIRLLLLKNEDFPSLSWKPCSKWFFSSCPCIKDPVYHASVYYYTTQVEGITTSCMFILFLKWFLIEGFKLHWCQISLIASLFTWFMKKYLFTSTDAQFLTNAKNKLLNNNDYIFIIHVIVRNLTMKWFNV